MTSEARQGEGERGGGWDGWEGAGVTTWREKVSVGKGRTRDAPESRLAVKSGCRH